MPTKKSPVVTPKPWHPPHDRGYAKRVANSMRELTVKLEHEGVTYSATYHALTGAVQLRAGDSVIGNLRWDGALAGGFVTGASCSDEVWDAIEQKLADVIAR